MTCVADDLLIQTVYRFSPVPVDAVESSTQLCNVCTMSV